MSESTARKLAAIKAVDDIVRSGDKLGLGTGRTVAFAIQRIAEKIKSAELNNLYPVATSKSTKDLCAQLGIPLYSMNDSPIEGKLDYSIDSADELNPRRQVIKGGGGALLLEKIVEYNSNYFYLIVDEHKLVDVLNKNFPLPIEIIPEAESSIRKIFEKQGITLQLRMQNGRAFRSDCGNHILDIFVPGGLEEGSNFDPSQMEVYFKQIVGVVESGIFTRKIDRIYIGQSNGMVIQN